MRYPKRSQYKYAKSPYRVRNWAAYEVGLRSRGDLTAWLSEEALDSWRAQPSGNVSRIFTNWRISVDGPRRMGTGGTGPDPSGGLP